MNLKFAVEEEIEKDLQTLNAIKKQFRSLTHQVAARQGQSKEATSGLRFVKISNRLEENLHFTLTKCDEENSEVSKLKLDMEELKREKEYLDLKITSRQKTIEGRNKEAVKLINIANKFYKERSHYQLLASERIAEAGLEAEEHRAKMQDLANRMEYYNQLITERQETYQRELLEAQARASNMNDDAEEVREMMQKRKQEFVEAFDKLMHSSSVWDIQELLSKFLAKEEQISRSRKYLEALKNDADTIREETATLIHDAQTMQEEGELRRHKSHPLSREISSTETRSDEYEKKIQGQAETIRKLSMILLRVKSRMSRCPPLERFKEARKRWDLVRSNLWRISRMKEKSGSERIHTVTSTNTPKYDPRRKTIYEELFDLDEAQQGLNLINDLQNVEMQSLRLLTIAQRLKFIPQSLIAPSPRVDKSSQKLRGAWKAGVKAMLRSPHHPTGRRGSQEINVEGLRRSPRRSIGRVESKMDKEINFITGPKFDVQSKRNKIQIPTYPTLKDIDTPRDSTFAMTSEEVKRYVMEVGYSERVVEKIKRIQQKRANQVEVGAHPPHVEHAE
mmetsp:Transcript_40526/g.127678  ORF Transcript_40526/g.127678 Transcript_40526/m.127678 type:complete len:564 (+) Transcript_40526:680-2371(+)